MGWSDIEYHTQRADDERRLAESTRSAAAALAHLTLSRLHRARGAPSGTMPRDLH